MVELLIAGLAEAIALGMEELVDLIIPIFGFDFILFNQSFPFAKTAYSIFQGVGLGIVLLLAATQILPFFFGATRNKTTPIRAIFFAMFSIFGIYYGNYIFSALMEIAQMPYDALLNASLEYANPLNAFHFMIDALYGITGQLSMLLYLVLLLLIGFAFLKLILEAVERYIILFVLIYFTPLAASTLASETTSGIFKKFFTMFISQCILLILNVWSLQMIASLFANMGNADMPALPLLLGYAFLRIANRLDSYMNALGLNAAVTGTGLGAELYAAGAAILNVGKKGLISGVGAGAGAGGAVLGAAKKANEVMGKINPMYAATNAVKGAAQGTYQTVKGAAKAGATAAAQDGTLFGGLKSGIAAGGSYMKNNFSSNMHDKFMDMQEKSWWTRGIGQLGAKISPNGKSVGESLETIFNNGNVSDQELKDIANTPFAANSAFNHIPEDAEVTDTASIAATMQGIGLADAMPEANEAIQAGYGNIDSDYMDYSMNANGVHMSYSANGKEHSWDVLSEGQWNTLSPQEQSAYTPFKNGSHLYYAKHQKVNDRPNELLQKAQRTGSPVALDNTNKAQFNEFLTSAKWNGVSPRVQKKISSAIQAGGQDVSGTMDGTRFDVHAANGTGVSIISGNAVGVDGSSPYNAADLEKQGYSYNKIHGNEYWAKEYTEKDQMHNAFHNLQTSGEAITLNASNKDQFSTLLNSTQWNGISSKTVQRVTSAIQSGGDNVTGGMDGNQFRVDTGNGYGVTIISENAVAPANVAQDGVPYTAANLESRGYTHNTVNGNSFWVKEYTEKDWMNTSFKKMEQTQNPIVMNDDNKDHFTDLLNSTHWNGISPKTQQAITTAVQGGDGYVYGGMDSRHFWIETQNGGVNIISSNGITDSHQTHNADGLPVYDTATLENRGYSYNKIKGREYWVKECTTIPDEFKAGTGRLFEEK